MTYSIRRIVRTKKYERWLIYSSDDDVDVFIDSIFLMFCKKNKIRVFLFLENDRVVDDEEYWSCVEGIYHDIGVLEKNNYSIVLKKKLIPPNMKDDEGELERYYNHQIKKLLKKYLF